MKDIDSSEDYKTLKDKAHLLNWITDTGYLHKIRMVTAIVRLEQSLTNSF